MQTISDDAYRLLNEKNIDVEYLHKLVSGEVPYWRRGSGKTFSDCIDLCSAVCFPKGHYILCKVKFMRDIQHILPMLFRIAEEYGIKVERKGQHFIMDSGDVGYKEVRFISRENWEEKIFGYRSYVEINFIDY